MSAAAKPSWTKAKTSILDVTEMPDADLPSASAVWITVTGLTKRSQSFHAGGNNPVSARKLEANSGMRHHATTSKSDAINARYLVADPQANPKARPLNQRGINPNRQQRNAQVERQIRPARISRILGGKFHQCFRDENKDQWPRQKPDPPPDGAEPFVQNLASGEGRRQNRVEPFVYPLARHGVGALNRNGQQRQNPESADDDHEGASRPGIEHDIGDQGDKGDDPENDGEREHVGNLHPRQEKSTQRPGALVAERAQSALNDLGGIRTGFRVAFAQNGAEQFPQVFPILIQLFELMAKRIPALNESARFKNLFRPDQKPQRHHQRTSRDVKCQEDIREMPQRRGERPG